MYPDSGELPDTSTVVIATGASAALLGLHSILLIVAVAVIAFVLALRYIDRRSRGQE
jgi:hypothetical protein